MPERLAQYERLGNIRNGQRRLHASGHAFLFDRVLQCERVHDGSNHTHVIGCHLIHGDALSAAPKIAAADYYRYLYAALIQLDELAYYAFDGIGIYTRARVSAERLAAQFEKNSLVHKHSFIVADLGREHLTSRQTFVDFVKAVYACSGCALTFTPTSLKLPFRMFAVCQSRYTVVRISEQKLRPYTITNKRPNRAAALYYRVISPHKQLNNTRVSAR